MLSPLPLPLLCSLFQTLWFDLHQRLSDSESAACTVSLPCPTELSGGERGLAPWALGLTCLCV